MSYKLRVGRGSRKSRERTCESRGVCRDVCAARASLAAFAGAFAQPAQVSRCLPERLRSLRKSCGVCRGVCAARASLVAFAGTFAQLAQVLRRLPERLRSPRKSCGVCRDVCAACAGSCGVCRSVCAACAGSRGVNRKKRGNKPAKSCSLSLLPNRRMSTLYPPSSTLY